MNKVLEFFKKLNEEEILIKQIKIYGWQINYDYLILGSIVPYLFEEFHIIENIAPENNENRDLRKKEKKYITIHDTGDTDAFHTSVFWSNTVYYEQLIDTKNPYKASFHYVVGNTGVYHNIPDCEVAYHAGDTTKYDYSLYNTHITSNHQNIITINKQWYYEIDGINTYIKVPNVDNSLDLKTINDQGILLLEKDEYYYIGETYYNTTYKKVANRGGNNNSIGIEMCINVGDNIYYNYLLTAKLVARLLYENHLTISDIKQHHYFSGKNCPQTLRENNLWPHFLHLVEVAVQIDEFRREGYQIQLITESSKVLKNGLINQLPKANEVIKYGIKTIFNSEEDIIYLNKIIND